MTVFCTLLLSTLMNIFTIVDFKTDASMDNWFVVNDGVMGGLSQGSFEFNTDGYATFKGTISLDNYGGFSSIRYRSNKMDVSNYSKIAIRLKGDTKKYQLRLKTSSRDYYSYVTEFKTSGSWETIIIDLNDLYPSFRGQQLRKPNFPTKTIGELGFLFGNKKVESFELNIEQIYLLK